MRRASARDLGPISLADSRHAAHRFEAKSVNNMALQNVIMQLRKVASHPFLFDWPIDHRTGHAVTNKDLVEASGKMLLLERLLDALFQRKHKVLLFSQFTTMLNIIEVSRALLPLWPNQKTNLFLDARQDWAVEHKGFKIYRIDGNTKQVDRQAQMNAFNSEGEEDGVCRLFILSTRAGGLGINLVAADTVIFYDQDWNPQMDLQAQDRAHRIGQKRPVLVFRLVTAHTVEEKILKKAGAKRRLEAMVIADGKFKGGTAPDKRVSAIDEATALLKLEGDKIDLVNAGDKIISCVLRCRSRVPLFRRFVLVLISSLTIFASVMRTSICCSTARPRRTAERKAGTRRRLYRQKTGRARPRVTSRRLPSRFSRFVAQRSGSTRTPL